MTIAVRNEQYALMDWFNSMVSFLAVRLIFVSLLIIALGVFMLWIGSPAARHSMGCMITGGVVSPLGSIGLSLGISKVRKALKMNRKLEIQKMQLENKEELRKFFMKKL